MDQVNFFILFKVPLICLYFFVKQKMYNYPFIVVYAVFYLEKLKQIKLYLHFTDITRP